MSGATAGKLAQALRLHEAGQLPQAQTLYAEVLKAEPDNPEALYYMGALAIQGSAPDQAEKLLRRAIAAMPDHAEAHNNLGFLLRQVGRTSEAIESYRRAVAAKPDYDKAFYNLGTALKSLSRLEEAREAFERAAVLNPNYAPAQNNLGNTLRELGRYDEAAACLRRAIEIDNAYEEAHCNLGNVLRLIDRPDETLACYQKALALNPGYSPTLENIGNLKKERGEIAEAVSWYQRALEIDPSNAEAFRSLSRVHRFNAADSVIGQMTALLGKENVPDDKAISLGFALAKAYEDVGRDDDAFAMLTCANRKKRAALDYDIRYDEAVADEIIGCVDGAYLAARTGAERGPAPIFVLGMPRSGSTLVEQILSTHSAVYGAGEVEFLRPTLLDGFSPDRGGTLGQFLTGLGGADLARRGEDYMGLLSGRRPDSERYTDKYLTNFWYVGLISLMLPGAKVVYTKRNAVDTCLSCYKNLFAGELAFTYDLTELGRYYRIYDRLMNHWRALLPDFVLDLAYEDLVADQEGQSRLLDFCGLDWDDAVLAYHRTERSVITASAAQVREPIFANSVGSWRRYERHLGP